MALTAKDTGGATLAPVPAGLTHAICYSVIDLGMQPSRSPQYPDRHKVMFIWEIPDERIDVEKDGVKQNLPRVISAEYTLSLSSKGNLRPMLESWRNKAFTEEELEGFDLKNVLGANCYINVVHKRTVTKDGEPRTYANVSSVNPLPKGVERKQPENPKCFFSFEEYQRGQDLPDAPEWIINKIKQSAEWKNLHDQSDGHTGDPNDEYYGDAVGDDDDVPF